MAYSAARRTIASTLSRTLFSSSSSSPTSVSSSRFRFALAVLIQQQLVPEPVKAPVRFKNSGSGYSPLNDPSPNWSNRPPKETILLDGCDYEHWLIVMEFPENPKPSEEEMVDSYVKTLAKVLGRYWAYSFNKIQIKKKKRQRNYFVFLMIYWVLARKRRRRRYTPFPQLLILVLVLWFLRSFLSK